ncbi:MAG: hypothetical protein L6R35_003505 [Caloplaca aegaea]|nr:MAG: hypothetical protein L6R35_003505 [Caloplaca aegaea]
MAHYQYYETSTESSPSPRMLQYNDFDSMNSSASYHQMINAQCLQQQQQDMFNSVEFTDLTAPVHEDRRRRKSTTMQDKQAISNMRIRRRAQNRASQRAFRERKEKHVQHLEQELETLEDKHRNLQKSHSNLGETNDKLKQEVEQLRSEIKNLKLFGDGSPLLGRPVLTDLDQFEQDGLFEPTGDFAF